MYIYLVGIHITFSRSQKRCKTENRKNSAKTIYRSQVRDHHAARVSKL